MQATKGIEKLEREKLLDDNMGIIVLLSQYQAY